MRRLLWCATLTLITVMTAGCANVPTTTIALPVPHKDIMAALINDAAEPIWAAAAKSDAASVAWLDLERYGNRLQIGGALLVFPGTGAKDAERAADPQWRKYAENLNVAGKAALAASRQRDLEALIIASEDLVEVCSNCHARFGQ